MDRDSVFLVGGMNGNEIPDNNCIFFNYEKSKDWAHGPALLRSRMDPACVFLKHSIFIFGGVWSQGTEAQSVDDIFFH